MIFLQAEGIGMINIAFFAAFFLIFYLFFIRPQVKKQKETVAFIDSIKKGDRVVTSGGIHGKVASVADNTVVLDVDSIKMKVEKSFINLDYTKIVQEGKSKKKK